MDSLAAPWSPWVAIRPRLVRNLLGFCAFELVYLVAYQSGQAFSPRVAAPFWFPDAVLLVALLSTRTSSWWLLLAATLPIRLFVDVHPEPPMSFMVACYLNDCAKAVGGALLLRRFMADPMRLDSLRDLGIFLLFVVALLPTLSAFGGAAARGALGFPYWPSFEQWLLGDGLANLVVTPIL